MATITNKMLLATSQSVRQAVKCELNVLTIPDDQIMNQIYATYVYADKKFDADSLFAVTKNILKRATLLVDNVVLMACKAPGEEIAHKTTMSILNKLSNYSWEAKAALTLAAFALDYGDFWLLVQLHSSDQLAKSMGILRRVPSIVKRPGLQKYGKAIVELNNLVKATLELIDSIFELDNLSVHDPKDVPALSTVIDRIPVIATGLSLLWQLVQLICAASLETTVKVSIEVLKKKNVLLFISSLDISMDEISVLKPVYDGLRTKDQYKIVWIPVVEQWTDELRKRFEMLRSKMPWYIVQYFSPLVGIKLIRRSGISRISQSWWL
ncbi:hypothetical protein CJ030_MR3G018689 [Morella rubra]|uniref:Sieve element occlusion N-terminal domain-containing protein n=1 Tax=Morella rubra TaxID=262757 RepID=A0A6A1W8H5_9ROSI|nr:hypothetical protein CJ030_MR3G018689 [Morella rubra]